MYQRNAKPVNLKALQIIHAALCAGMILFLLVTALINQQPFTIIPANDNSIIIYVAIAIAAVVTVLSFVLFGSLVSKIDTAAPVAIKLPKYVSACIVRYALIEGGALLNVSVFLITGCLVNAGLAVILILLMVTLRPQRQQIITDFKIYYPDSID